MRALLSLCLVLFLLPGCSGGGDAAAPPREVFVLGVSALDFDRIDALTARGELPHFRRLLQEGVRAEPAGFDPLGNAALWVSVQTGKLPRHHGVLGNLEGVGDGTTAPARSVTRRAKTLWQMVSDNEKEVVVVGMPATWPAEVVRGRVVSNTFVPTRWTETRECTVSLQHGVLDTYPPSLDAEIQDLVHPPSAMRREDLARFFTLNEREYELAYDEPLGSVFRLENPLRDFVITYQADRSFLDLALSLREEVQPALTGCLLELPSVVQSFCWFFVEPEVYANRQENARRFGKAVDETYRWVDEQLGRVMDALPADAGLVVVSEHGFGTSWRPDDEGGRRPFPEAQPHGVLILHGPGLRQGVSLEKASVVDLTPTVLAWLGMPLGDDLDGRPLVDAFTPAFAAAHRPVYRDSYEKGWDQQHRFPVPPQPRPEP